MTKLTSANQETGKVHKLTSRLKLIWFPIGVLLNTFSMTALLLILGVAGHPDLAADIGLVHGATLATFYVFSANARNLILTNSGELAASRLLQMRLLLLLPLAFIAYFLSVHVGSVTPSLALVMILRRGAEWFGELGLSQHERLNHKKFVQSAVLCEVAGFFLCLVSAIGFGADLAYSAIPWAIAPLMSTIQAKFSLRTSSFFSIYSILPHIGSTAIIGICVYVFRISVTVLIGKAGAGELFTAFAIGGIIPTIFGQALAPTLMRHFGPAVMKSGWLAAFSATMLTFAAGVVMMAIAQPTWLVDAGHTSLFWLATGLSIAGGAIMIFAALLRTHLIHGNDQEVFGPDMLANILLVTLIPVFYFTLGMKSMAGLYLLSACLNLAFMWGASKRKSFDGRFHIYTKFALGLLLVAPIFFQLKGNLFSDPSMFFDPGGQLLSLPIPLSVFALFGGIAILGNYQVAKRSLTVMFFTLLLILMSVLREQGFEQDGGKIVLMSQFLLPIFGLVLGEMYGADSRGHVFERAALLLLLVILPAQLMATWIAGHADARPLVFVFSIYQHIQYFPVIVAALATMASLSLWGRSRSMCMAIGFMLLVMPVHLVASVSINAIAYAGSGMAAFMTFHWREGRFRRHLLVTFAAALLATALYVVLADGSTANWTVSAAGTSSRVEQWRFFADEIAASPEAFLFGHATRPDRNLHPNAHNYWLDATYSFGILAILPLIGLMAMTMFHVWKQRGRLLVEPHLLGAMMAAGYLVLVEGMLNIGMRQPYPGILTFFIFGLLVARLRPAT